MEIHSRDDLAKVAAFDHLAGVFKDGKNNRGRLIKGYRSKKTFERTDALIFDIDNTEPDPLKPDIPPEKWLHPSDIAAKFPGVPFYVVYSRNHMKVKDGKPARPKFHIYFFLGAEIRNERAVFKLKSAIRQYFPAFDEKAVDTAHFIFGVKEPKVEFFDGDTAIDEFMRNRNKLPELIPIGQRNSTLSQFAAKTLKALGDTEKARASFDEAAERCEEPLEESELETIWNSAKQFFHNTIEKDPNYIPADAYDFFEGDEDSGKKKPATIPEVKKILEMKGITIRLNMISGMAEITGMPEAYSKENASNTLPALLMDFFTYHNMKCTRNGLDDILFNIMDENRYNPVADMIKATGPWDKQDRIAECYDILRIRDNKRECIYVQKWLHQCVSIGLNSVSQPYGADGVLVLQGSQGSGKTLFCSKLSPDPDLFAEGVSIDLTNKDSVIQSTGVWLAELGELDSTLKREQLALKAFLTAKRDTYRLPYARTPVRRARRTSFCATVNPEEFLNDETGSRRFWVIHTDIDVERVKALTPEWARQLWRQVYEEYYRKDRQGFRLTKEEQAELQQCNRRYEKAMPGEMEILDSLNFDTPVSKWQWTKVSVLRDALNIRNVTAPQVGRVLAKLARDDGRIAVKTVHNVKQYLLPPKACNEFMHYEDDDIPPLTSDYIRRTTAG